MPAADKAPFGEKGTAGKEQAPAEVAAERPVSSDRQRRRAAKSVLSIKEMSREDASDGSMPAASRQKAGETEIPTDERIEAGWQELIRTYSSQPRLASALGASKLEYEVRDDSKTVIFRVVNVAQKQWIEEKRLRELEAALQKSVGSSAISLRVDVLPDDSSKVEIPYTQTEQAQVLMQQNAELRELIVDLGFDIK